MDFFRVFGISRIVPIVPVKRAKNDLKRRKPHSSSDTSTCKGDEQPSPNFELFLSSALDLKT